ncbi:MAG: hypothetical protein N3D75_04155 [Candidatus Aenigmarchaeota archaeon]|nr:hypothetical protein [Candidatus Aenigmarchaeota archaeon]
MKGVTALLEATLAGVLIIMIFLYFLPQYSTKSEWSSVFLQMTVNDVILTIDNSGQLYNFARNTNQFDSYMNRIFSNSVYVWWKDIEGLPTGTDTQRLYFTKAKKATMVDVVNVNGNLVFYSFTLYMGYVF